MGKKAFERTKLDRAVELIVIDGKTLSETAREVGVVDATVDRWRKRPEWSEACLMLQKTVGKEIAKAAWSRLDELLHSSDEALCFKVACEILNRTEGMPAPPRQEPAVMVNVGQQQIVAPDLTDEQVEERLTAIRERRLNG